MDRRPWWETRGRGRDVDPTRPARIASSRQRRVRTSGTVPLRAPRRRARLIPRRTRALPLAQRAAVRPRRCHCAWRSRRPTPTTAMRDTPRPRPCPANARLRRDRAVASAGGLAPASFSPGGRLRRSGPFSPVARISHASAPSTVIRLSFYNFVDSGLVSRMAAFGHGVTAAGTGRLDRLGRARRAADGGFKGRMRRC